MKYFLNFPPKKWMQYVVTFTAALCTFSSSINSGWPNSALPKILSTDYPLRFSTNEAGYVINIAYFGNIIGHLGFLAILPLIGRKYSLMLLAIPQISSFIILCFTDKAKWVLYLARFVGGISEGPTWWMLPLYVSEIADANIRGTLVGINSFALSGGMLYINIIGTYFTVQTSGLLCLPFPVLFIIIFSVMPESPYYLLTKNNISKARDVLKIFRGSENVEEELLQLKHYIEQQSIKRGKWYDIILLKSYRNTLFITLLLNGALAFSGQMTLVIYGQTILEKSLLTIPKQWASSFVICCSFVSLLCTSKLSDVIGRKPLYLIFYITSIISLCLFSLYYFLRDYTSLDFSDLTWITLVIIIILSLSNYVVVGLTAVLTSELFAPQMKNAGACITNIFVSILIVLNVKIFQAITDNYSLGFPFIIYAIVQLTALIVIVLYVPETCKKSLEQIQQDFKT